MVTSPYAVLSVVVGSLLYVCSAATYDPAATTISIVPNILGFTVGAMAIMLAFSSGEFFTFLTEGGHERSLFMKTIANFVHFILVHVSSLLVALLFLAHPAGAIKFVSSILLTYAILTTLSAAIHLFQMATLFNLSKRKSSDERAG